MAEELDLPLDAVQVILGDTGRAPNQGPTIASTSLQIHAQPLRLAAQVHHHRHRQATDPARGSADDPPGACTASAT